MSNKIPLLQWCVVSLGEDAFWWVDQISDEQHWDTSELGIIDPRQVSYIMDALEPLCEYGFDMQLMDSCFFAFKIHSDKGKGRIRLERTQESILDTDEQLFLIPDILDEEKGLFHDFIDSSLKARVKLLNDMIDFKQKLTTEEIEEALRENQQIDYIEGRRVHFFQEIASILDYVPQGYEVEGEEEVITKRTAEDDIADEIPDIDDEELEQDETMRWGDEEDPDQV